MIRAVLIFCLSLLALPTFAQTSVRHVQIKGGSAPSNPPPGYLRLWSDTDGALRILYPDGTAGFVNASAFIAGSVTGSSLFFTSLAHNYGATVANSAVYLENSSTADGTTPLQAGPEIRQLGRVYNGSASQVLATRMQLTATSVGTTSWVAQVNFQLRRVNATAFALSLNFDGTYSWITTKVTQVGDTLANRPTCDSTLRGGLFVEQATAGNGDIVQACMKGTADTYAWRDVFTAP